MRHGTVWYVLALSLSLILLSPASEAETRRLDVGLRSSVDASNEKEKFEQYELFASHELPWSWQLPADWCVSTKLDATAGALRGAGETGLVASIGPSLVLSSPGGRVSLEGGSSPTVLSRDKFGRQDFGVKFQFTSHASLRVKLSSNVGVGYRYQHMSNAGMSSHNPGLDLHMLELSFHF